MKLNTSVAAFTRSTLVVLGIVTLLFVALAAQSGQVSAHSTWEKGKAYVRVVHASPAAGKVDVFVDGATLLSHFTFGTVTGYVKVPSGTHEIQVAPAGKGRYKSVIDVNVSLSSNTYYTAAAVGLGTKAQPFALQAFVDKNADSNTKANVRVYHLSPNAGPVDVSVGNTKVISLLTYKNASGYLTVAPGTYTFHVTAVNAHATLSLTAALKKDLVYSVFAIGLFKGNPSLQFVVAAVDAN